MKRSIKLFQFTLLLTLVQFPCFTLADNQNIIGDKAADLPLFDAHMHWKQPAWAPYPPETVLSLMDSNGVAMALLSSSPDSGTITLWEYAPDRFVPEMRPYNDRLGPSNWTKAEGVGDFIEERVRKYSHQGIGEFHLHQIDPQDEPLLKRIVSLATSRKIPLHVHSGYEPVEYLFSLNTDVVIIWAHAGMVEPADVVEQMMARYSNLYADTSFREWDILNSEDGLNPDWKRVLERFSDRFMVGTDTWVNSQWENYAGLIDTNRRWLAHLKTDTAKKIAYQNAERLFGKRIAGNLDD